LPNTQKAYINFARGLNTEASLINFPDGFSSDEENYSLLINGSRRRRLGLALEADGSNYTLGYGYAIGDAVRSFDWENVAGDPTLNFIVVQVGFYLHIYKDTNVVSTNKSNTSIDLRLYKISGATNANVAQSPVDCSYGLGHLFVTHRYITPFWIKYTPDTDTFTVTTIKVEERDFEGVDDGYSNSAQPSSATPSHTYNLKNRGWTDAQISAFQTSQGKQPSKAMIPWLGLERPLAVYGSGATQNAVYHEDGVRQFSPAKLVAELFQDASAPQGHFIRDPFDTTSVPISGPTTDYAISTWTISGTTPGTQTITVTTSGNHGLSNGDTVQISGTQAYYFSIYGTGGFPDFYVPLYSFDGTYTVSSVTSNTFQISVTFVPDFDSWAAQYAALGTVTTSQQSNPTGEAAGTRFKTVAFFAGRVWYAGAETPKLSTKIYFTQIIESEAQYGKCYQVADPTDERISDIVPSDGGVIVIPEAANVVRIMAYGASLLVFASNGVWQIGPGADGYFTATSYSVRKITDSGTVSPAAIVMADNSPMYWGLTDIYAIVQDPNSGFLVAQNISQNTINTLYNEIPQAAKLVCQGVFDDLNKKIIWLYSNNNGVALTNYSYNKALLFDVRLSAFTKYGFGYSTSTGYVGSIFVTKYGLGTRKIKYVCFTNSSATLVIAEARNFTTYQDFGVTEPECYLVTGYDTVGDSAARKYAPYIYVFSNKTEEGYTVNGDQYTPIRESSTKMQARWDWADLSSAGKWGAEQEVYRHSRLYVPNNPNTDKFDDGQPMIVTKNKVRGTGRSLHLKFKAGTGKDSWLAGWQILYDRLSP
jgi:hypothetical protein